MPITFSKDQYRRLYSTTGEAVVEARDGSVDISTGPGDDRITLRRENKDQYAVDIEDGERSETLLFERAGLRELTVHGGSGDDRLSVEEGFGDVPIRLDGEGGDDLFDNGSSGTTMSGGPGDDGFFNPEPGTSAHLQGGGGDDEIINEAYLAQIDGGPGDDGVFSRGDGTVIRGGPGDDQIESHGEDVVVRGGGGSDVIDVRTEAETRAANANAPPSEELECGCDRLFPIGP
jgi:hypothetical protein